MLNTFKELFKGNKALFKDTYAYDHWDFEQTNPVIRLDLSCVSGDQPEEISATLLALVYNAAELMDIELRETPYSNVPLTA
jgi:hypothetical protein